MEPLRGKAVEYNLTEHCNLRCAGCNHASPHLPERFASVEDYRRDMRALAGVLHVEEFKLVGGEPLLHPRFLDFLRIARELAFAHKIIVITNGVLLHRFPDEAWPLVDALYVSLYPGLRLGADLDAFEATAKAHAVELWRHEVPVFELAMLNRRIDDDALVRRIFGACRNKDLYACHTVYEGRYYKCSPAPFMPARVARVGLALDAPDDGVPLHDDPATVREALSRYLASAEPLAACHYCLGTSGPERPHRLLDRAGLAAELREDHAAAIDEARRRL